MRKNLVALWVYVVSVIFTDKKFNENSLRSFKRMISDYESDCSRFERYVIKKLIAKYTKLFNLEN